MSTQRRTPWRPIPPSRRGTGRGPAGSCRRRRAAAMTAPSLCYTPTCGSAARRHRRPRDHPVGVCVQSVVSRPTSSSGWPVDPGVGRDGHRDGPRHVPRRQGPTTGPSPRRVPGAPTAHGGGARRIDAYGEQIVALASTRGPHHRRLRCIEVIAGSGHGASPSRSSTSRVGELDHRGAAGELTCCPVATTSPGSTGTSAGPRLLMQLELPTDVVIAAAMAARPMGAIVVL